MALLIEQLLNGIQLGLLMFLLAAGLTLVFGIMDLVNLAHGSLYMLGAYFATTFITWTGSFVLGALLALPATLLLLGLFLLQADRRTRLQRIGAFLLAGGIGGAAPLLALVVRIRNVCGGSGQVGSSSGGGGSYECYSIETLWALIPYGTVLCLGVLLLFLAWRRRAESIGP